MGHLSLFFFSFLFFPLLVRSKNLGILKAQITARGLRLDTKNYLPKWLCVTFSPRGLHEMTSKGDDSEATPLRQVSCQLMKELIRAL